jgi:hypothetical protein
MSQGQEEKKKELKESLFKLLHRVVVQVNVHSHCTPASSID